MTVGASSPVLHGSVERNLNKDYKVEGYDKDKYGGDHPHPPPTPTPIWRWCILVSLIVFVAFAVIFLAVWAAQIAFPPTDTPTPPPTPVKAPTRSPTSALIPTTSPSPRPFFAHIQMTLYHANGTCSDFNGGTSALFEEATAATLGILASSVNAAAPACREGVRLLQRNAEKILDMRNVLELVMEIEVGSSQEEAEKVLDSIREPDNAFRDSLIRNLALVGLKTQPNTIRIGTVIIDSSDKPKGELVTTKLSSCVARINAHGDLACCEQCSFFCSKAQCVPGVCSCAKYGDFFRPKFEGM